MAYYDERLVSQLRSQPFLSISREISRDIGVYIYNKIKSSYTIIINPIRIVGFIMKTIPKPLVLANQWTIVVSVVLSLITQTAWILLIPLISCLLGLLAGFNPVLAIVKKFLTKPANQYEQEDYEQLQFNQWLAVGFLFIACISFLMNWTVLFNISTIMVGIAALVAILGFCIGCFIRFQYQQWTYRRKKSAA